MPAFVFVARPRRTCWPLPHATIPPAGWWGTPARCSLRSYFSGRQRTGAAERLTVLASGFFPDPRFLAPRDVPPSPSRQEGDRRRRGREIRNGGPPSAINAWRFSPVAPATGAAIPHAGERGAKPRVEAALPPSNDGRNLFCKSAVPGGGVADQGAACDREISHVS
jgi:hypothetical protein